MTADYHSYLVTVVQRENGYSAVCEDEKHDLTPLGQGHGESEAQAINRAVADHLLQRNKVTAA